MQLKGRNFLKLMDYTPEEITYLIDLSQELKEKKKKMLQKKKKEKIPPKRKKQGKAMWRIL